MDDKFDQIEGAFRSRVTNCVTQDDGTSPATDRSCIEPLNSFGIGPDGVFGHVHRRKAVRDGELHSIFRGAFKVVDGPIFDEASDGAGAQERRSFNRDSNTL